MGGLFGGPKKAKTPPVPEPEPPPAVEDAEVVARNNADTAKRRKGAAAMLLTGKEGAGTPNSATKTLLGG